MSNRSTATYPSPLCKNYWRDAAAELRSTKTLVIAALMIALRVATKGLAVPIAPNLKLFSVAGFINALGAMIIGPVMAIPAALLSDFLGVLLWEGLGTYFLPYALTEIASSLIWALLLYRAKVTTWRVMLGRFVICVFAVFGCFKCRQTVSFTYDIHCIKHVGTRTVKPVFVGIFITVFGNN